MRIMISQPMKGKTNEEIRKERETLVKELEKQGHIVVDTVIDDYVEGEGNDYAIKCLAKSVEYIATVDAVVFMLGWEKSRGCCIEHEIAKRYGKFIKKESE